jgi:hypothetical protein
MFLTRLPQEKAEEILQTALANCDQEALDDLFWHLVKANAALELVTPLMAKVDPSLRCNRALARGSVELVALLLQDRRVTGQYVGKDWFKQAIKHHCSQPGIVEKLATAWPLNWEQTNKQRLLSKIIHFAHLENVKFIMEAMDPLEDQSERLVEAAREERSDILAYLLTLPNVNPASRALELSECFRYAEGDDEVDRIKQILCQEPRLEVDPLAIKRAVEAGDLKKASRDAKILKRRLSFLEECSQKKLKIDQ